MTTLDDNPNLPDPNDISARPTGFRYGIILVAVALILQLVSYLMGGAEAAITNPTAGFIIGVLSFAATIAILVMGVKHHRDQELGGFISFGRCMTVIFWMGLIYGLVTSIWNWIFMNFISPDSLEFIEREMDRVRVQVEDGEAPEFALTLMEMTHNMTTNPLFVFVAALLSMLFYGLFVSLFMKRSRPYA